MQIKKLKELFMDKEKYTLAKELAENELQKMLDYYEIDIDEIEDKELKKAIKAGYDRLIKAVRLERLQVVTEDGIKIIQTLKSNGSTMEYREIDGKSKMAMAGKDEKDYYGKSYALMGSLSGYGENVISNMKGVDLSLVETLGMIFLAV
jgi:Glu-tRNA(Gln) amidotransferase subunit E-like FAD-binding protein